MVELQPCSLYSEIMQFESGLGYNILSEASLRLFQFLHANAGRIYWNRDLFPSESSLT
jgi:hypothetical protein